MKIAIITGGETGEREISIKSALHIAKLIDFAETELFTFPEEREKFIEVSKQFEIVIPVIHGIGGEDGELQAWLKTIGIPFIFSDTPAHAIAIDKKRTKEVANKLGITTPAQSRSYPLFAKPRFGGSSVSTKICDSKDEFETLQNENPQTEFITEELISGREFTVGIIESNGETISLPVIEIIPKGIFFDFENKYDPKKQAAEICPAEIDKGLASELQQLSLMIHTEIGVRHISRSDFIVTRERKIYFLEINTIPGMTEVSLLPKMLKTAGLSFSEVVKEWIENILKLKK